MATTKMACADGLAREQAFLTALAATDGWRTVDRQVLELLDASIQVPTGAEHVPGLAEALATMEGDE